MISLLPVVLINIGVTEIMFPETASWGLVACAIFMAHVRAPTSWPLSGVGGLAVPGDTVIGRQLYQQGMSQIVSAS